MRPISTTQAIPDTPPYASHRWRTVYDRPEEAKTTYSTALSLTLLLVLGLTVTIGL